MHNIMLTKTTSTSDYDHRNLGIIILTIGVQTYVLCFLFCLTPISCSLFIEFKDQSLLKSFSFTPQWEQTLSASITLYP